MKLTSMSEVLGTWKASPPWPVSNGPIAAKTPINLPTANECGTVIAVAGSYALLLSRFK